MPTSISHTLDIIVEWFEESRDGERVHMLSKLAMLELCGWLEGTFDEIIIQIGSKSLADATWLNRDVIAHVHGFHYEKHFRRMLTTLLGEIVVRRVEHRLNNASPGELERFKGLLTSLWKTRCDFAHTDLVSHIAAQATFNAPSWVRNQYETLEQLIVVYQQQLQLEVDLICNDATH